MVYRYSPEVHEFVKKWCAMLRDSELADACNQELGTSFTASSMKAFRGNHGYRNYKKQYTSEEFWKYQKRYPQGMYEYIRDNSWGVSSEEMAKRVNEKFGTSFSKTSMKQFRQRHGIKSGLTGWYQKGHPPGNKGKKLEEYITDPEHLAYVRERNKIGGFKPGNIPANLKQIGDIVVGKHGYLIRKKQMKGTQWERWEFLHVATWEEHNGPVPDGMVVTFKDGDRSNCDIDNLMLVTKGENCILTRKGYRFKDPELTETALNLVRLQNAAKSKRKECRKGTKP